MAVGGTQKIWRSITRNVDRVFDGLSARPFGIAVFAASIVLLVYLQTGVYSALRTEAVGRAQHVDHPARIATFVARVYVLPGDSVEIGAPLVDLSPHFIDRELSRLDAEVQTLLQESKLAQARLLVEEQRWLNPTVRLRPDRPSLEKPTEALFAKELELLQLRRRQLQSDRESLTITSRRSGRVVYVVPPGTSVGAGSSVAQVSPQYAEEIVAYVPPTGGPGQIEIGALVHISRPGLECRGEARVLRRGAAVEEAPGQLRSFFRFPLHGMPVYISIPPDCQLGIGQVLTVEFRTAVL